MRDVEDFGPNDVCSRLVSTILMQKYLPVVAGTLVVVLDITPPKRMAIALVAHFVFVHSVLK